MHTVKQWIGIAIIGLALLAGGCATGPEPFDYTPTDEIKPGPGLFSGEDGVFTLYGKPDAASTEKEDQEQEAGTSGALEPDAP